MSDGKASRRWYWMPATAFLLGILATLLLIWINQLSERQQRNFALGDMVSEILLNAATGHLWLEEVITGTTLVDIEEVWADFDRSISLADALLSGGKSARGTVIEALQDPDLQAQVEALRSLLLIFRTEARERFRDPKTSGIGTEKDAHFNELFKEITDRAMTLDLMIQKIQARNDAYAKRLFLSILFVWVSAVFVVGLLISNREVKRRRAEEALQEAHDRLEQRVQERTAELTSANRHLESEITERKLAEEHIKLYEEVAKNMPIGLYVFLHMGIGDDMKALSLVAANPVAAQFAGISTEDIVGRTMSESVPIPLRTEISRGIADVIHSGRPVELAEVRYAGVGDPERFFSLKAFPLPNNCVGVLFEDITSQKGIEEALRESESRFRKLSQQFRTLLEAITDPLTLLSPDLKVQWWNKAAGLISGKRLSDPAGQHCYSIWHDYPTPCEGCPAVRSFSTGRQEVSQLESPRGRLWELKAFPIRDEAGGVINVLTVASDITEKVTMQAEAMRAAHLVSLGELAAGVAHEINNPINGIINYAQILSDEAREAGRESNISTRIIVEGNRIANIVRSLLSFARERKEEKVFVNAHDILCEAFDLVSSQIRKDGIILKVHMPKDLPQLIVHPQQIQQVFLNLINNARYALNQKYPGLDKDKILEIRGNVATADGRSYLKITFHDHGVGIPDRIKDKVIDPFFTTKPRGVGTGLGLSITHGIINSHDGRLAIQSIDGEFTKIEIFLPVRTEDEAENSRN